MSNYEFWDELGKIFNAVMAYQEKTVEFNKRFINPWIRLGNVFDTQDRNKEAICAYEQAIELDPNNAQNWFEMGNLHFKMESFNEAINAYNKAIELDPAFGWPFSNLALTFVAQGKHLQAIPLYRKSIELLEEDKDKAVAWNRLGNVYRKLNEYDLAVEAFQRADDLDQENGGLRDNLDEASEASSAVSASDSEGSNPSPTPTVSPIEQILADQQTETTVDTHDAQENSQLESLTHQGEPNSTSDRIPQDVAGLSSEEAGQTAEASDSGAHTEETLSNVVQGRIETFTHTVTLADTSTETSDAAVVTVATDKAAGSPVLLSEEETLGTVEPTSDPESTNPSGSVVDEAGLGEVPAFGAEDADPSIEEDITAAEDNVAAPPEEDAKVNEISQQAAYEQFLKDSRQPVGLLDAEAGDDAAENNNAAATQAPVAINDATGELQIEMDTKNAHVWNELGNVYFNTSAYDDAIGAYSKAIELDRWFAWPYSNLALAYVQKGRFVEAILLFQRSIELFTSEKDKAISWNRLGNVYRRLNDYENAIASYQRADELDPDNTTLSRQSRFSLLGSFAVQQKPSYVS